MSPPRSHVSGFVMTAPLLSKLRAAVWPDWVRPARPGTEGETFKGPEITSYHRGDWPYINTAWVLPQDLEQVVPATRPESASAPSCRTQGRPFSETIVKAERAEPIGSVRPMWIS